MWEFSHVLKISFSPSRKITRFLNNMFKVDIPDDIAHFGSPLRIESVNLMINRPSFNLRHGIFGGRRKVKSIAAYLSKF